ncbi:MAG: triose-phosphate isomerase [Oscillospiraceae bacterium]|nr:triose-phosphate isomerase [Oscillospiraceae bacterium]
MNRQLRQTVIAGNWKMNMLTAEAKAFADALAPLVPDYKNWCEVVICAPFVLLPDAAKNFKGMDAGVGAQNMSEHPFGAFTGEICAAQLADIGVSHVIIGHSERREYYGENDCTVNAKVLAALSAGLKPILCVGESLKQRETGVTNDLVSMQVKAALHGVSPDSIRDVIIAYEPVWAIGTGMTATPEDAQSVCAAIRDVLKGIYGEDAAQSITIQYGGSMNDKNAFELLSQPDIDGGLIGGASLKPETFAAIINAANQ